MPKSLVKWSFIGLFALPVVELLAFVLVAAMIGWLPAAGLFVATSIVGVALLKRSGRGDLNHLRAAFARDGIRGIHLEAPGAATLLGGILLTFPGFVTDLAGAALLVPAIRRWVGAKLVRAARRHRRAQGDRRVIDLEPGEWHQIRDQHRPRKSRNRDDRPSRRGTRET